MAYTTRPDGTQEWKPENDSVADGVAKIINSGSPLMQGAEYKGKAAAASRGLLNSDLAIEAGQKSVIDSALPIASQDSAQAAQKNLSTQQYGQEKQLTDITEGGQDRRLAVTEQGQNYRQREGMLSNERIVAAQERGQSDRLATELGSREKLAEADRAAEKERLGLQLTSNERIALDDRNAAQKRLDTENASQEKISGNTLSTQERISTAGNTSQEKIATAANQTQRDLASLDNVSKEKIAGWNIDADSKRAAITAVATFDQNYSTMMATVMNNEKIPADVRATFQANAARVRDSNLGMIEQMYGIHLDWATPSAATPVTTGSGFTGLGNFP